MTRKDIEMSVGMKMIDIETNNEEKNIEMKKACRYGMRDSLGVDYGSKS